MMSISKKSKLNLLYNFLYKSNIIKKEDKKNLNLIVIGHVDAGKSTLMGHFLYKMKKVPKKTTTTKAKTTKQQGTKYDFD